MRGLRKEFVHAGLLDHLAGIHDRHALGMVGHHAQVVGDEEHAHAGVFLQARHQRQNLRLNRHVEGGGGLISDQHARLADHGHGNHDALAHAARELVRVLVQSLAGGRHFNLLQRAQRLRTSSSGVKAQVQAHRFGDLLAHRQHRVQAGHGFLKDHGDLVAAQAAHVVVAHLQHVMRLALRIGQQGLARTFPAGVAGQQAHQAQGCERFATAGLAHQGQGLSVVEVKADTTHQR